MDPRLDRALEQQKEDEKERERAAQEKIVRRCYLDTFHSPAGRVVLKDLRKQFYDVTTYVPGDPYGTHVAEGGREVILRILTVLAEEAGTPQAPQTEADT